MSVLIRIHPIGSAAGVTQYDVRLADGRVIGMIASPETGEFTAHDAKGCRVVWDGAAIEFPSVADAAIRVWMAFIARSSDPAYQSEHA